MLKTLRLWRKLEKIKKRTNIIESKDKSLKKVFFSTTKVNLTVFFSRNARN